jgi:zinc transport system substrate-binding protein
MRIILMRRGGTAVLRAAALTAALTTALTGALAGCGTSGGSTGGTSDGTSDGADAGLSVITAAYPYQFVAERVGGAQASVDNLTAPGVEPHDVELTPQQVAGLEDADLLVYERTLQTQVDDAVDQLGLDGDRVLDVTSVVPLEETGALAEHAHEGGTAEHESDEHESDDHESGEETALDPHIWLAPDNLAEITEAVADRMGEVNPDDAAAYRSNGDALVDDLRALDERFREGLRDCERMTVVTSHDAFRYLAAEYGLDMVAIAGIEPSQEPSPARQAEIADIVAAEGVTTIFTEELVSPAVADSIAAETGAELAVLSPIEGLSDETADEDYLSLMQQNLTALQEANGCE